MFNIYDQAILEMPHSSQLNNQHSGYSAQQHWNVPSHSIQPHPHNQNVNYPRYTQVNQFVYEPSRPDHGRSHGQSHQQGQQQGLQLSYHIPQATVPQTNHAVPAVPLLPGRQHQSWTQPISSYPSYAYRITDYYQSGDGTSQGTGDYEQDLLFDQRSTLGNETRSMARTRNRPTNHPSSQPSVTNGLIVSVPSPQLSHPPSSQHSMKPLASLHLVQLDGTDEMGRREQTPPDPSKTAGSRFAKEYLNFPDNASTAKTDCRIRTAEVDDVGVAKVAEMRQEGEMPKTPRIVNIAKRPIKGIPKKRCAKRMLTDMEIDRGQETRVDVPLVQDTRTLQTSILSVASRFYADIGAVLASTPAEVVHEAMLESGGNIGRILNDVKKICDEMVPSWRESCPSPPSLPSSPSHIAVDLPPTPLPSPALGPTNTSTTIITPIATHSPSSPSLPSASLLPAPTNIQGAWHPIEVERLHALVLVSQSSFTSSECSTAGEDDGTTTTEDRVEVKRADWEWVCREMGGSRTRHQILIKAVELGLKERSLRRRGKKGKSKDQEHEKGVGSLGSVNSVNNANN